MYLDTLVLSVINKETEDIPLFRSAAGKRSFVFQASGVTRGNDLPESQGGIDNFTRCIKVEEKKLFLDTLFFLNF